MKLKYYLRGLGIGIVVTALIMTIAFQNKNQMTDDQIREQAAQLGMVDPYEEGVLADSISQNQMEDVLTAEGDTAAKSPAKDEAETESLTEEESKTEKAETEESETDEEPKTVESPETEESETAKTPEEPEAEEAPETTINEGELVTITVNAGDGSDTVARKLAEAGLVSDASAYDKFLCQNGYDKRICTGAHNIPKGADEASIAQILTSKAN